MKKSMIFVLASLVVNAAAIAAPGPNASAKCREIADKVREAKAAAPAAAPSQVPPPAGAPGTARPVN